MPYFRLTSISNPIDVAGINSGAGEIISVITPESAGVPIDATVTGSQIYISSTYVGTVGSRWWNIISYDSNGNILTQYNSYAIAGTNDVYLPIDPNAQQVKVSLTQGTQLNLIGSICSFVYDYYMEPQPSVPPESVDPYPPPGSPIGVSDGSSIAGGIGEYVGELVMADGQIIITKSHGSTSGWYPYGYVSIIMEQTYGPTITEFGYRITAESGKHIDTGTGSLHDYNLNLAYNELDSSGNSVYYILKPYIIVPGIVSDYATCSFEVRLGESYFGSQLSQTWTVQFELRPAQGTINLNAFPDTVIGEPGQHLIISGPTSASAGDFSWFLQVDTGSITPNIFRVGQNNPVINVTANSTPLGSKTVAVTAIKDIYYNPPVDSVSWPYSSTSKIITINTTDDAGTRLPLPYQFRSYTDQEPDLVIINIPETMQGNFTGTRVFNISAITDSAAPGQQESILTGLYFKGIYLNGVFTSANSIVVSNNDIIQPVVKSALALANTQRLLTFNTSVSNNIANSISSQFSVQTRAGSLKANAFDFVDIANANPASFQFTNIITITGIDQGLHVPVTVNNGTLYINNVSSGQSGMVALGDQLKIGVLSNSQYSATDVYTVNIGFSTGKTTDSFSVTTRHAITTPTLFNFANQFDLEPNVLYQTNVVQVTGIETSVNASVTLDGVFVKNGIVLGNSISVVNSDLLSIQGNSAVAYGGQKVYNVIIGSGSDFFTFSTRQQRFYARPFSFIPQTYMSPGISIVSNTIEFLDYDGNTLVTFNSDTDATANLIVNDSIRGNISIPNGSSDNVFVGSSAHIVGNAALEFASVNTYVVTAAGRSATWYVTTKTNDDLLILGEL